MIAFGINFYTGSPQIDYYPIENLPQIVEAYKSTYTTEYIANIEQDERTRMFNEDKQVNNVNQEDNVDQEYEENEEKQDNDEEDNKEYNEEDTIDYSKCYFEYCNIPYEQINDSWVKLDNFYGAYIKFYVIEDLSNNKKIAGFQRTKNGGERRVYLIKLEKDQTQIVSPLTNELIDIPEEYYNNSIKQIPIWHISYTKINSHNKINQLRKVNDWIPYNLEQSNLIENDYQSGNSESKLTIGQGEITIEFGKELGDRTLGYQILLNYRKHFVKRLLITEQKYNLYIKEIIKNNIDLKTGAVGDTDNCSICLESLNNIKCIKLPCNHMFHSICCQIAICTTGQFCPYCTQSTVMIGNSSSSQMYSGR